MKISWFDKEIIPKVDSYCWTTSLYENVNKKKLRMTQNIVGEGGGDHPSWSPLLGPPIAAAKTWLYQNQE